MSNRPMPRITPVNQPFWKGCDRGELLLQRCTGPECRKHVFYPRVCCPHCGNGGLQWVQVSGRGRIVSFTKVHRPQHESFRSEIPIYFLAVRVDEGPLLYSRLAGRPSSDDRLMGQRVRVRFIDAGEDRKLPFFELED